jgi:ADP-ribose pyrophosphatase YjhB (NUDIX family)
MEIFALLDELQTIARNGLHYTSNPYDRERYEKLLGLALGTYTKLLDAPEESLRQRLLEESGHITPKLGASAGIFNDRGEILLMDRADGGGWCLPCGWVEPNEKPCQAAVREVLEETGLEVRVLQLVGVITRMPGASAGPHTVVSALHLCQVVSGELTLSQEGLELRYWPIEEVPRWHLNHADYARAAYALWKTQGTLPAISD